MKKIRESMFPSYGVAENTVRKHFTYFESKLATKVKGVVKATASNRRNTVRNAMEKKAISKKIKTITK